MGKAQPVRFSFVNEKHRRKDQLGGWWELRNLRRLGYWDNNMNANSVASEDDGTNKLEMSEWP